MKAYHSLPDGYREIFVMNLQDDKRTAAKINIGGMVAMILVIAAGHFIVPITEFFNMESLSTYFIRLGVLLAAYLVYMVLHELTYAAVMKAVGGGKVVFGFTGMYAFAGSHEDYFDKSSYRCALPWRRWSSGNHLWHPVSDRFGVMVLGHMVPAGRKHRRCSRRCVCDRKTVERARIPPGTGYRRRYDSV